jgi:hypothetical protein
MFQVGDRVKVAQLLNTDTVDEWPEYRHALGKEGTVREVNPNRRFPILVSFESIAEELSFEYGELCTPDGPW